MLFRETVAVYCENHTEHTNTLCGQKTQSVPHRKHCLRYKAQQVNAVMETVAVYCENHTEHTNTLCAEYSGLVCKVGGTYT
jgi:translation initiation factor IF-1